MGQRGRRVPMPERELVSRIYWSSESLIAASKVYGVSPSTFQNWMMRYQIPRRPRGWQKGKRRDGQAG